MLNLFFNFLHSFEPQPIFLRLGLFNFYWYSFLIVIGLVLGFFLTSSFAKKIKIKKELIEDLFCWLIIGGFVGARLYHVFSEWTYYLKNPLDVLKVWQGGLGIFGGVIAGLAILFWFSKKHKLRFFLLADILAPSLILGQAIGRWGNYFNREVFGLPTNQPWGIPISLANRPIGFFTDEYFHPTFLYESLWNLLVFLILFFLLKFIFFSKKAYQKNKIKTGIVFSSYLILYSFGRFFLEFLRIDSQPLVLNLRLGQFFALLMFITGVLFLFFILLLKRSPKHFLPQPEQESF